MYVVFKAWLLRLQLSIIENLRTNLLQELGELAEWSNAAVLKTVEELNPPGVRIPRSPPLQK